MRLLLDSHFAFWVALSPAALTTVEQAILRSPDNQVFASTVSIWELKIKWEKRFASGERKGPADPADVLRALTAMAIPIAPLLPEYAAATLRYPVEHKDPFDEQLLIHAQALGLLLLTRDDKLIGHSLAFVPE